MIKVGTTRDEMVKNNLGLVHSLSNRFKGRGIEYDDLFSAGSYGLVKAVDRFEPERGLQFSTYAVPVILGEIKRLFRDGGAIKVSRSLKELSLRVSRTKEILSKSLGREATLSELSAELGEDIEDIIEAINVAIPPMSLTIDDGEIGEFEIEDKTGFDIIESLSLNEVIQRLAINDQRLITLRYFESKTQSQTAKILEMTQVQVSRREKKLLEILRSFLQ